MSETAKPRVFVGLDLETTGLHMSDHGIIQIGAWATGENEHIFKGYFVSDVNPDVSYYQKNFKEHTVKRSKEAFDVHGISEDRIASAPPIDEAIGELHGWLKKLAQHHDVYIVGQNVPFDVAWLKKDFHRFGFDDSCFRRVIDNVSLGFVLFGKTLSQKRLAEKFGIKNSYAHDALGDAYTCIAVFHEMKREIDRRLTLSDVAEVKPKVKTEYCTFDFDPYAYDEYGSCGTHDCGPYDMCLKSECPHCEIKPSNFVVFPECSVQGNQYCVVHKCGASRTERCRNADCVHCKDGVVNNTAKWGAY